MTYVSFAFFGMRWGGPRCYSLLSLPGEAVRRPLYDRDVAGRLWLRGAGGVVVDRVGLEVHDEDVDDRVGRRVKPGDVDLVIADWDGHVIFRGELHADIRAGDR